MSIQTVTQSTVPTSTQATAAQNTGTQAVMINLKAQGQALQGVAQSLATTHAGMAAQMAIMNDPKASKKEKADATAAYNVLAQDAVDQQGQMDDLKSVIDSIINQQLPQAQQADKAQSADAAETQDQDKQVTDAAAEKSDQDNIDQQAQDVLTAAKSLTKLSTKSSTVSGLDGANDALSLAMSKLGKSLDAAAPSTASTSSAVANSGSVSTNASDAYTGTTGATPAMSAQATVVSDIAQGQSAEDIGSYLSSQGITDPKINDLVGDAVKKAKDGRFAAELAQGSFDELLGSIDKAFKSSTGQAPTASKASKATANAGRATASVGGTSFASGTTGTAASTTGATSTDATANAGGATANASGTTTSTDGAVADIAPINTQQTGTGQTNDAVLGAQPAATGTVDSMSANELLMYIMLMATGELNKEMRDMAKTMQAQTQQKAGLRSQVSDAQKTYDTSVQSDGTGKASTATTNDKESLDDLNNKMDSIGDDMQQQQLRMQQIMQVQQQMMTAVSSVSKSLNDTSMSILRKIGG